MSHPRDYSEEVAALVDEEVKKLIEYAHDEAWEILVQYRDVLDALVLEAGADKETLAQARGPEDLRPDEDPALPRLLPGYGKRLPSDRPPVLTPKELALTAAADVKDLASPGDGYGSASSVPAARPRNCPRWPRRRRRRVPLSEPIDTARIERAVRRSCIAIGEDPGRDGLIDTPARVAHAYTKAVLRARASAPRKCWPRCSTRRLRRELILVRDIEVYSTCEHHLVPFFGSRTSVTSRTRRAR